MASHYLLIHRLSSQKCNKTKLTLKEPTTSTCIVWGMTELPWIARSIWLVYGNFTSKLVFNTLDEYNILSDVINILSQSLNWMLLAVPVPQQSFPHIMVSPLSRLTGGSWQLKCAMTVYGKKVWKHVWNYVHSGENRLMDLVIKIVSGCSASMLREVSPKWLVCDITFKGTIWVPESSHFNV